MMGDWSDPASDPIGDLLRFVGVPATSRRVCERSGDYVETERDDYQPMAWNDASTWGRAKCGTCGADVYTETPHNDAVRLPEHRQGQVDAARWLTGCPYPHS
jgi:hypothetical protein